MSESFIGSDIFGNAVAAVRGNDGSVIFSAGRDDDDESNATVSLSAASATALARWLAATPMDGEEAT